MSNGEPETADASLIDGWEESIWHGPGLRLGREQKCVCGEWKSAGHVNQCKLAFVDLRLNWVLERRTRIVINALVGEGALPAAVCERMPMEYLTALPPDLLVLYSRVAKPTLKALTGWRVLEAHVAAQEKKLWAGDVTHLEAWTRAPVVPGRAVAVPDSIDWYAKPPEDMRRVPWTGAGMGWVPAVVYVVEAVRQVLGDEFDLFARVIPPTDMTRSAGKLVSRQTLVDAGEPVVEEPKADWWPDEDLFWRPSRELVKYFLRKDKRDVQTGTPEEKKQSCAVWAYGKDPIRTAYVNALLAEIETEDQLAAQVVVVQRQESGEDEEADDSDEGGFVFSTGTPAKQAALKAGSATKKRRHA